VFWCYTDGIADISGLLLASSPLDAIRDCSCEASRLTCATESDSHSLLFAQSPDIRPVMATVNIHLVLVPITTA